MYVCVCVYVCMSVYALGCSLNVINSVLLFKMVSFAGGVAMYILGGKFYVLKSSYLVPVLKVPIYIYIYMLTLHHFFLCGESSATWKP